METAEALETKDFYSCISLYNNMKRNKNILHYPQLDTVLMVEKFIYEHSGEYKKRALWEHLPKKMMYQTYCVIIDYLLHSGKIGVDREGTICWVWDPKGIEKLLKRPGLRLR